MNGCWLSIGGGSGDMAMACSHVMGRALSGWIVTISSGGTVVVMWTCLGCLGMDEWMRLCGLNWVVWSILPGGMMGSNLELMTK